MTLINKSKVKEFAKIDDKKLDVSADFYPALDEEIKKTIEKACKRARANSRNTVMARDL